MPPLQVKDCPEDVYERLRACAKEENRSISQQTLTILQEFLDARDAGLFGSRWRYVHYTPSYSYSDDGVDYTEHHRRVWEEIKKHPSVPISDTRPRADILLAQIREEEMR